MSEQLLTQDKGIAFEPLTPAPISVLFAFGSNRCASTFNAAVVGRPSGSIACNVLWYNPIGVLSLCIFFIQGE